jgi:hypothetical protein
VNIKNRTNSSRLPTVLHRLKTCLAIVILSLATLAWGGQGALLIERIADSSQVPSAAEIDALEEKAKAGDKALKEQFAAAYLYERLANQHWNWGCKHLPHGHRCRAMAARGETGEKFLREIIDSDDESFSRITLMELQADYAHRRLFDARPDFAPEHPACREAVRYFERAIENELVWSKGIASCSARRLAFLARDGRCMPKNDELSRGLFFKSGGCPKP